MPKLDQSKIEARDFARSFGTHEPLRVHLGEKQCVKCGSKSNLTKHHYNGQGKGPWDWMCRKPSGKSCHDEEHDFVPRGSEERRQKRLMRRAQTRIKRDILLLQECHVEWVRVADDWSPVQKEQMLRYLSR